jgi:hypothetical protein
MNAKANWLKFFFLNFDLFFFFYSIKIQNNYHLNSSCQMEPVDTKINHLMHGINVDTKINHLMPGIDENW